MPDELLQMFENKSYEVVSSSWGLDENYKSLNSESMLFDWTEACLMNF